ncbi:MAG: pyridoxal phosphate-dependent aminotransferase [Bacteroidetes bacterium]|nr:pyridoxal phosphate-dependent aminotransferase [Bacteroidota bacterium]
MNEYNFDKKIDRKHSDSVKWDSSVIAALGGNPDAEPFWVADMEFSPPPAVTEALKTRVSHPVLGYPVIPSQIIRTFCSWLITRHNWEVPEQNITFTPGLLTGIASAIHILSKKGEGIIVQTPAYNPFFTIIEKSGRTVARNPLRQKERKFFIDFQSLEKSLANPVNTVLLLCSPHNPAGRVWNCDELARIVSLCETYNVAVIADEIHADLTYPGITHTPFSSIAGNVAAITFMAPSKTFNIAGEKIAFSIISDPLIRSNYHSFLESMSLAHPSVFAPIAALAAYEHGYNWLNELLTYLRKNMELIDTFFNTYIPEMELIIPEASFIAFIDCKKLIPLLQKKTLTKFFSKEAGVLFHDGNWFGPEGKDFVRINFGTQTSALQSALERIREAVDILRK